MRKITDKNHEEILKSNRISFVFFTKDDCHLCVGLKPVIKKLSNEYSKDVDFYTCDVNKERLLTTNILDDAGVPTGFVLSAGRLYKVKDPEDPDEKSWYTHRYLEKIIKSVI